MGMAVCVTVMRAWRREVQKHWNSYGLEQTPLKGEKDGNEVLV